MKIVNDSNDHADCIPEWIIIHDSNLIGVHRLEKKLFFESTEWNSDEYWYCRNCSPYQTLQMAFLSMATSLFSTNSALRVRVEEISGLYEWSFNLDYGEEAQNNTNQVKVNRYDLKEW